MTTHLVNSTLVTLPAGLGWCSEARAKTVSSYLWVYGTPLSQVLQPSDSVRIDGDFWLCEESKPILFHTASILWRTSEGMFDFTEDQVSYVRAHELADLEAAPLPDPASAIKPSNEQYYRYVFSANRGCAISADVAGSARLTAQVNLAPGAFTTHFPIGTRVMWGVQGALVIENDQVAPTSSVMRAVSNLIVQCDQNCVEASCMAGVSVATLTFRPFRNELHFTADGGLQARGTFQQPSSGYSLEWGAISNSSQFAQRVGPLSPANFFMPGHFLSGVPTLTSRDRAPADFLLEGVRDPLTVFERPGSVEYADGLGDYAGLNFRRTNNASAMAESKIGGATVGPYQLTTRSKYYARASGVSGIHEAESGSFPSNLTIYGYAFRFSNYGLAYRSSVNVDSRTKGDVDLPYPSDFTQRFDRLKFSCLGALEKAEIPDDDAGEKLLVYWKAKIIPKTLSFQRNNACAPEVGFLTLGVETRVAHISEPLQGTLGFKNNGNLIARSFDLQNVDSRLSLPNVVSLAGPTNGAYTLTTVSRGYFNDYETAEDQGVGSGYFNLPGSLDVPFFQNMLVHARLSADYENTNAPVYLAGGWPTTGWEEGGKTFFTTNHFDVTNRGRPADTNLAAYWGGEKNYRPRARQKWLGLINFDYPLRWNNASRVFKSFEPEGIDVLVLRVQNRVDYLTPEVTKLSFASSFNPLPVVAGVDSALQSNIDLGEDKGADFFKPLGEHVVKALKQGDKAMDFLLTDLPSVLLADVMDHRVDPLLHLLATNLLESFKTTLPGADFYTNLVNGYFQGTAPIAPPISVRSELEGLLGEPPITTGLIQRIDQALLQIEWMIDAMASNVTHDAETGQLLAQSENGILGPDPFQQQSLLLTELIVDFISELECAKSLLPSPLKGMVSGVMSNRMEAMAGFQPTFASLKSRVAALRARLQPGQDLHQELHDTVTNLSGEIDALTAQAASAVIQDIAGMTLPFDSYTADELAYRMRFHLQNVLYGSKVPTALQTVLRRHFYDLNAAVEDGADGLFGEVNDILHDVVSSIMNFADDKLTSFLGSISPYAAAATTRGYARFHGDSLNELRLDGNYLLNFTTNFNFSFKGFILIKQLQSQGHSGCQYQGDKATEVTLAAEKAQISLLGCKVSSSVKTRFAFEEDPFALVGLAGAFELAAGKVLVQGLGIKEFGAAMGFGLGEGYMGGRLRGDFQDAEIAGGLFLGRACTLDPIKIADPNVAEVLGAPPFTGLYVYGEGWVKILDWGWLDVGAGVGYGVFAFAEGPLGGKMKMGLKVGLIKIITVQGDVTLIGVLDGLDPRLSGTGSLKGCIGWCPFCLCVKGWLKAVYQNESFDVDVGYEF